MIPMAKYWFELGLALGIDEIQLDNIPVSDSSQCFRTKLLPNGHGIPYSLLKL